MGISEGVNYYSAGALRRVDVLKESVYQRWILPVNTRTTHCGDRVRVTVGGNLLDEINLYRCLQIQTSAPELGSIRESD